MVKPVVSSTIFSFPKLLLWSLPLFVLGIYTILSGGFHTAFAKIKTTVLTTERYFGFKPIEHGLDFIPDFILRVTLEEFTQSCITKSSVVLVNGTSPGPEIRLEEGNIYWIRVFNDMNDRNLTMHWHGLSMAVSPFSDGTPGVSQYPIPPNHYFDYELDIEVGHSGTYFYHSHIGFQASTCAGPLIVEDSQTIPYNYDDERTIALSDIFDKTDNEIEEGLLSNPFQWSGETRNILVNGQGLLPGHESSLNCELAVIDVEPDKIYRFRFIGGTALSFVTLAFESHPEMELFEADGDYIKPVSIDHVQIGSGQRYSALFKTKTRSELGDRRQFFIQMETRDRPSLTRAFAILNYLVPSSKRVPSPSTLRLPKTPPISLPATVLGWDDHFEAMVDDSTFPLSSEVSRRITIRTHQIIKNGLITWQQDDFSWIETFPTEPYLVSLYKNDSVEFPSLSRALNHSGIDPITKVFPASIGEVIEIIIQNTGSDAGSVDVHPFHMHGKHYFDLGSGDGTYDWELNEKKIGGKTLARRDTTMLYKYRDKAEIGKDSGWRAWRLRVEQPGAWQLHCHILAHMVMGMQTVWVMGNESEVMKVSISNIKGYLDYGGSVNGNDTHFPHVVHFKGKQTATKPGMLSRMTSFWNRLF